MAITAADLPYGDPSMSDDAREQRIAELRRALHDAERELRALTGEPLTDATLLQNQALLRIAGQTARMGGWMIELPQRTLSWSDEVCAIHDLPPGYRPTLEEGLAFFPPEHRAEMVLHVERCVTEGLAYDVELPKRTAKGRLIWVRTLGEAVRDGDGRIIRIQGAIQDITARKQAERELAQQTALLDQATDAIFVRDLDHRVTYWNRGAERLYGWTAAEALGRRVDELLYRTPGGEKSFRESMARVLVVGEWAGELRKTHKSGRVLTVEARWTLLRDEQGQPRAVLTINTDVTEKKKLEAQFFRAQRMESIGTLAGGIAHDLNNVLAPIMMSIEVLRRQVREPDGQEVLDMMESSAQRGADLVKQVLSFARGVEGQRKPVDPGVVLQDIQTIVRDTFPKSITLTLRMAPERWAVLGDRTQLHQVLTNLCVNARDAMPMGGLLSIALENVVLDEVFVGMNPDAKPGRWVLIKVSDNGVGIPLEAQERIFEPFFTTKELGKGTGLGLSTTLAIVRSHGGFVSLTSEVGKGTTFRVYLPASDGGDDARTTQARLPTGNGEMVLLVDDEEGIRSVAKKTLERFGYRVLVATDGADALAVFARHRGEVAVVLTDMSMPILDGPALITALRAIDPAVRIIGSSGLNNVVPEAEGPVLFISKPYTAEVLLRAVQAALATRPPEEVWEG